MEQIRTILRNKPEEFFVLSGDDALTLDIMDEGGLGVISVAANTFPEKFCRCIHGAMAGNITEAENEMENMDEAINLLFKEGNPVGAKCMASVMGLTEAEVRLPLVEATESLRSEIKTAIQRYDLR